MLSISKRLIVPFILNAFLTGFLVLLSSVSVFTQDNIVTFDFKTKEFDKTIPFDQLVTFRFINVDTEQIMFNCYTTNRYCSFNGTKCKEDKDTKESKKDNSKEYFILFSESRPVSNKSASYSFKKYFKPNCNYVFEVIGSNRRGLNEREKEEILGNRHLIKTNVLAFLDEQAKSIISKNEENIQIKFKDLRLKNLTAVKGILKNDNLEIDQDSLYRDQSIINIGVLRSDYSNFWNIHNNFKKLYNKILDSLQAKINEVYICPNIILSINENGHLIIENCNNAEDNNENEGESKDDDVKSNLGNQANSQSNHQIRTGIPITVIEIMIDSKKDRVEFNNDTLILNTDPFSLAKYNLLDIVRCYKDFKRFVKVFENEFQDRPLNRDNIKNYKDSLTLVRDSISPKNGQTESRFITDLNYLVNTPLNNLYDNLLDTFGVDRIVDNYINNIIFNEFIISNHPVKLYDSTLRAVSKNFLAFDVGLGYVGGTISQAIWFAQASFYFRPVDRSVPLNFYRRMDCLWSRLSVDIGLTLNTINRENEIAGFAFNQENLTDRALLVGLGIRVLPFAKFNSGLAFYRAKNENPLISKWNYHGSFYIGASIDFSIRTDLNQSISSILN